MPRYEVARRGRRPLWIPGVLTIEENGFASELVEEWKKATAQVARDWQGYVEFCRLNQLAVQVERSLLLYLASLRGSKLEASSTASKFRNVVSLWRRFKNLLQDLDYDEALQEVMEQPSAARLVKMQDQLGARHRTRHAVDATVEQLEEIIVSAPRSRPRVVIAFLVLTGLRLGADCLWLQPEDIFMRQGKDFAVDIDKSKNRHKAADRITLNIPFQAGEQGGLLWRPRLVDIIVADRSLLSFRATDAKGIGTFFESLTPEPADAGRVRHFTTYTLRRNFFHRVIEFCTDAQGIIDWERAILFTLHKKISTLQAAYAKRARDRNAEWSEDEDWMDED